MGRSRGLLIRKHRELISVVVPGYGDGPPRFGSSTRVGQRPRGWSDAVPATLHPGTPSSPPFRYGAELRPTPPGNDQRSRPVGEPQRAPGWPSTALGSVPSLVQPPHSMRPHTRGVSRHGQTPMTPRHALFAKCLWMDRWGSRRVHCLRDRALWGVQTQGQIETCQSPARFMAFPPPRLLMPRRPRRRRLVDSHA